MSRPLDPARPLWQFLSIENYDRGGAVLGRIHHAVADGIALGRGRPDRHRRPPVARRPGQERLGPASRLRPEQERWSGPSRGYWPAWNSRAYVAAFIVGLLYSEIPWGLERLFLHQRGGPPGEVVEAHERRRAAVGAAGHRGAVGAVITTLPAGCTTIMAQGVIHHSCSGVYYRPISGGFRVVVF